jgi:hypothetical protein
VSLDSLTLALVVSGLGVCTDEAVADLRRYVESKAIAHTSVEFDASLERANDPTRSVLIFRCVPTMVPFAAITNRLL